MRLTCLLQSIRSVVLNVTGYVLVLFLLPGLLGVRPAPAQPVQTLPNIVLILTDDQGWGDVFTHGNPLVHTPTLDRLAREGARFERFYVDPVCAPTRAALLTGRYALRTGVHGVTRGYETMRAGEVTLAETLRQAGYATGIFGKWHNGAYYPNDPIGQGFDVFFGFAAGHWNNYFDTDLVYGTSEAAARMAPTRGYITDVLTDSALAFIERNRSRPFFAYVPYNAPHSPFQVPDAYYDRYAAMNLDGPTATVYGMVENLDDNIARILDRLDRLGLEENTIVLFLTDNGPNGDRYNGAMRGRKGSLYEGGVRVPLFVRWPGVVPANEVISGTAAHIDVLPTLLDFAGIRRPRHVPLDGISLAPSLREPATELPDRLVFTYWGHTDAPEPNRASVRSPRWRAVRMGETWELYDMAVDPSQHADVAALYPDVVDSLASAYARWFREVTRSGFDPIPTELGRPESPEVLLRAPEAFLRPDTRSGIRYVVEAGWANDWVTEWTNPDAYAEWPIQVVESGKYDVGLLYNASEAVVGVGVQVAVGDSRAETKIDRVFQGAAIPSPDRVKRQEVYEREWAEMPVGALNLQAGEPTWLRVRLLADTLPAGFELKGVRIRRAP